MSTQIVVTDEAWKAEARQLITLQLQTLYIEKIQPHLATQDAKISHANGAAEKALSSVTKVIKLQEENGRWLRRSFYGIIANLVLHLPTSADSVVWNWHHQAGEVIRQLIHIMM